MILDTYPRIADWIGERNGRLLIHTGKVDIGQRISTALAQIAHEELTIPLRLIDIAPVRTGTAPDEGVTSGSNSVEQSGHAVRCAAASLRCKLLQAAVEGYGGDPASWRLEDGILYLPGTNHRLRILDVIGDVAENTAIDRDAPFAIPGAGVPPSPEMRGIADMVHGQFLYVQDLDVPGMLHARVIHPPQVNARLSGIDTTVLNRISKAGHTVVRDGSFLAVAGPAEWPLIKAALELSRGCVWENGDGLSEEDVFAKLAPSQAARFGVVDGTPHTGPLPEALPAPDLTARYERPYQMHAALAPSAALALWDGKKLSVKSHSQGIYPLKASMCDSLGLLDEQLEITHVPGSGCYGHNGADDAAFDAALIAMALPDRPVLLKWTREDEHAWEPYAPAMAVDLAANCKDGRVTAWSGQAFSDTHRGRPRPGANRAGPGRLLSNRFRASPIGPFPAQPNMGCHAGIHRNLDPVYSFADTRLIKNLVTDLPHRTSAMRTLGATANIFATESFMDELAVLQGVDPLAFRRAHLEDPRALNVLAELQRQMDQMPEPAEGGGRGIAYAQYKNRMTRVGICVDLTCSDQAEIRLEHVVIVADAGRVIDSAGLTAQLEGGFVQGASWALHEQVTWDRDGILSRDWSSYPVVRFDHIPKIEVVLLNHPEQRSVGAGEATPGPAVAAIANAVFDATGIRIRRMPFTPDTIKQAAFEG